MSKSPSHVYQRASGYYACVNVPKDVLRFVKKRQLRYSLHTRLISEAKHRAGFFSFRCRELFGRIRKMTMEELTDERIERLVQTWMRETADMFEAARIEHGPYSLSVMTELRDNLEKVVASYRESLGSRDHSGFEGAAKVLLQEAGLEIAPDAFLFKKLCRELLKAALALQIRERQQAMGEVDDDLPALGQPPVRTVTPSPELAPISVTPPASIRLSRLFAEYEAEMLTGGRWRDKTRRENGAMLETLKELIGDAPVDALDKATAREYKAKLLKYPKNRHKQRRYRDKSIEQIWAMPNLDTVSVVTVNNHLVKVSAFGRWAVNQGYLKSNPFENLTVRTTRRAKDDVLPFDQADLEKLFGSPLYREHGYKKPFQFWLPVLGLFTGARLEEICQLRLVDVREADGVWCLDINSEGDRNLKTKSSVRLVPIHPKLLDLGILEYVQHLRRGHETRLFPELSLANGKYGHYASKWFGRFKRSVGFPDRQKSFHSFRHNVASMLRKRRVQDYEIKLLLGHETGSATHDRYGQDEPVALLEVIKELDYGIDLSHLKFKTP